MTAPPVLETERLVLRGHTLSDLDDVAAMWADERVGRYIGFTRNRQDAWFTMARYCGFWTLLGYGYWVARHRATGAFVGELGFADFQRGLGDDFSRRPEAGWAFAPDMWSQGYGTEAVTAIHRWLDKAGLSSSSVCVIDPENTASRRIADRLGYTPYRSTLLNGTTVDLLERDSRDN